MGDDTRKVSSVGGEIGGGFACITACHLTNKTNDYELKNYKYPCIYYPFNNIYTILIL